MPVSSCSSMWQWNINGDADVSLPNVWQPALVGLAVEFQGLRLTSPTTVTLSNPVQMQFR